MRNTLAQEIPHLAFDLSHVSSFLLLGVTEWDGLVPYWKHSLAFLVHSLEKKAGNLGSVAKL